MKNVFFIKLEYRRKCHSNSGLTYKLCYITLFPIADITYTLHKENVDYATAKKNCKAAGMTLAMPTTEVKLKDLKSAVGNQLTGTSFVDIN